jgi:hypothetical protein
MIELLLDRLVGGERNYFGRSKVGKEVGYITYNRQFMKASYS